MTEKERSKTKGSIALKIVIPAAILLILAGIWFFKNAQTIESGAVSANISNIEADNADFELNITEAIDLDQLKSYGLPILIDFGADSCIPCKEMAPVLIKLNGELRGKAIIRFVDVWKYKSLATGYPVNVIPTQILIDANGNPYTPKGSNASQFILYSAKDTKKHVFTAHEGGMTEAMIRAALLEMGMKK